MRVEQERIARRPDPVLAPGQIQCFSRGAFGFDPGFQGHGIGIQGLQHIGHVPERLQHHLPVLRRRLVMGGNGGPAPGRQLTAAQNRLHQPRAQAPDGTAAAEQFAQRGRLGSDSAAEDYLGKQVGGGHADPGARRMEQFLGSTDIRTLARQGRRQADGQLSRQPQLIQPEFRQVRLAREPARIDGQQVPGLRQFLFQLRQRCPDLGQLRLLRQDFGASRPAELEPALHEFQQPFLHGQVLACCLQLRPQRSLHHHGGNDIGSQGQMRRLKLETLEIHLGPERLQFTPAAAEQVQVVGNDQRGVVEPIGESSGSGLAAGGI